MPHAVLVRLEGGQRQPGVETARALARWLGWSLDQVIDAARQPPGEPAQDQDTAAPAPVVESPPESVATTPAPMLPGVRDRALILGRTVLSPWASFAGTGLRRRSSGLGFVAILPTDATARDLPGVKESYSDRTPGLSVEARADALDAWLMRNGAKVAPLTSKPSPS